MRDEESSFVTLQLPHAGDAGLQAYARSCVLPHKLPSAVPAFPISEIDDLRIEQALVIKDLLLVMLGHEGAYIRYLDRYNASDSRQVILGPDFRIAKHMDISLKGIAKKLVKIGKQYCGLSAFVEFYDEPAYGKVVQRLCHEISRFLYEYHTTIEQLELLFNSDPSFTISILENKLDHTVAPRMGLFYNLIVALDLDDRTREVVRVNPSHHNFSNFIENIQRDLKQSGDVNMAAETSSMNRCKGGVALNILYSQIADHTGNHQAFNFLTTIYNLISIDYVAMLNKWLGDGIVDDQFDEFLIKENAVSSIFDANSEKYWDELYTIRIDGLVHQCSFNETQAKLLATGKYLNVFKACANINDFLGFDEGMEPIASLHPQELEVKLARYFDRANRLMLKLLFDGMEVTNLVSTLQQTYLVNNSFHLDSFVAKSFNELRKNKHGISTSRLAASYKDISAGRNGQHNSFDLYSVSVETTGFFDLANEILNVKSFDAHNALASDNATAAFKALIDRTADAGNISSAGSEQQYDSKGIEEYTVMALNLDTSMPFPLNLIFTQNFVFEYQMMFKLQALLAFTTQQMNVTWNEINCSTVWKFPGYDSRIIKWLLRCRVLQKRMKDFLSQFQRYIDYDVVEPLYLELSSYICQVNNSIQKLSLVDRSDPKELTPVADSSMHFFDSNSIFEEKNRLQQHENTKADLRVEEVRAQVASYLNGVLRDSFLTHSDLITVLKNIVLIIIQYNEQLVKFKKHIIMLDSRLFEEYSHEYPAKFDGARMGEHDIEERFNTLNDIVTDYYLRFNMNLSEFIYSAKAVGEMENARLLILVERLELCFPS